MNENRNEINRWFVVSVLAALLALLGWSAGVVLSPAAELDGGGGQASDYPSFNTRLATSDSVLAALKSLTTSIERRGKRVGEIVSDTAAIRKMLPGKHDSLQYAAYDASIEVAFDSARISALRALSLSSANAHLVTSAEVLAARERRMWRWLTRFLERERAKKHLMASQGDSSLRSLEDFRIGLEGYHAAALRANADYAQIRYLRDRERFLVTRKLFLATLSFPLSLGLLLTVWHFGRTGTWTLAGALGIAKRQLKADPEAADSGR